MPGGRLVDAPPATLHTHGLNLPAAGEASLRLLSAWIVQAALRDGEGRLHSDTFYLHSWEMDTAQPQAVVRRHCGGSRLSRL